MQGKTVLVVCGSGLAGVPVTKDLRKNQLKGF